MSQEQIASALAEGGALHCLTSYRQFLVYQLVPDEERPGKTHKYPVNAQTLARVDAHNSAHWCDSATALAAAQIYGDSYGVAFVFTAADPFWFFDIDDCINPEGEYNAIALELQQRFAGAAVEVSQSGKGLHIFGWGQCTVPSAQRRKKSSKGFDLYTELRFVALTGDRITGQAFQDFTPALNQCVADYLTRESSGSGEWTNEPHPNWSGPDDNDALVRKILASRKSAKSGFEGTITIQQIWKCDTDALAADFPNDQDHKLFDGSRADASLARRLGFWTGNNCERIRELMYLSPYATEGDRITKWDARPSWLEDTIVGALVWTATDFYQEHRAPEPMLELPAAIEHGDTILGGKRRDAVGKVMYPDIQVDYFANHVYIMDQNKIACPDGQLLDQARFNVWKSGPLFLLDDATPQAKPVDKAWDAFTLSKSLDFPKAHTTCFRPEERPMSLIRSEGITMFNTYVPIATHRVAGDAGPFLGLVRKLLPDPNDQRILLTYMASLVRNPGCKFQWWPVVQGVKGNGKTLLIQMIEFAVGSRYSFMPNTDQMADSKGKFNNWLDGKLFIGMEEVYVQHRREFLEAFKPWVTNLRMSVEGKGKDQMMIDNRANGFISTNHKDGVPLEADERRYAIFFTAQQSKADKARDGMTGAYFSDLYDWAYGRNAYAHMGKDYGRAVVNDFLRSYELAVEYDPAGACQEAPRTSSTTEALSVGLGRLEQEVLQAIEQEQTGFRGGWISSHYLEQLLEQKSRGLGPRGRSTLVAALGYMAHPALKDGRVNNAVIPDGIKSRLYVLPGHLSLNLTQPTEVAKAYTKAQSEDSPDNFDAARKAGK